MKEENIVKKVCKELGITQKELAEMLDIPAGTVSRWASTDEIPKMAKIALECMLENKKLKDNTFKGSGEFDVIKFLENQGFTVSEFAFKYKSEIGCKTYKLIFFKC